MNDFTKEYLSTRYDDDSVNYILENNNLRSFKEYCTCGAFSKEIIRHQSFCHQQQEVMKWKKNNE